MKLLETHLLFFYHVVPLILLGYFTISQTQSLTLNGDMLTCYVWVKLLYWM